MDIFLCCTLPIIVAIRRSGNTLQIRHHPSRRAGCGINTAVVMVAPFLLRSLAWKSIKQTMTSPALDKLDNDAQRQTQGDKKCRRAEEEDAREEISESHID